MASSKTWICDGIPKDGKEYPDLGGPHDPRENFAPDCEECGLPRESSIPNTPPIPIATVIIAVVALMVAIAGGAAVYRFVAKECEPRLEKIDGQCIDPFLQPFQEATQEGDGAVYLAHNYQTLEDLKKADSTITSAITKLIQIPSEALVYPQAKIKLGEYDQKRAEIRSNITKEETAQEQLKEVETLAQEAKQETDLAKTTSQLEAVKQKLQEANNKLQEIDNTSLIASQIGQHKSDYEQQIKAIDERIASIARQNTASPRSQKTYTPPKVVDPPRTKTYIPPRTVAPPNKRPIPRKVNPIPYDPCAVKNPPPNCLF